MIGAVLLFGAEGWVRVDWSGWRDEGIGLVRGLVSGAETFACRRSDRVAGTGLPTRAEVGGTKGSDDVGLPGTLPGGSTFFGTACESPLERAGLRKPAKKFKTRSEVEVRRISFESDVVTSGLIEEGSERADDGPAAEGSESLSLQVTGLGWS